MWQVGQVGWACGKWLNWFGAAGESEEACSDEVEGVL